MYIGVAPLLLLVIIIGLFTVLSSKNGGRTLAMLLGACFLAFLFMATLWVGYARVEVTHEQAQVAELRAQAKDTEEIWEEMNRPRIQLSSPPRTKMLESTDSAVEDDAAEGQEADKVAVSETKERPAWVDMSPKRIGNVYREVVVSQRFTRVTECHQDLNQRFRQVIRQRIDELVGRNPSPSLERLGLSLDYVWSEICHDEWIETVDSSVGEMKRVHVLMEFDAAVDKRLERAYRDYRRGHRIEEVGAIAAVVLAILLGIYALLKIDTWTRGYYTKRLFFGVPAAIILLLFMLLVA